MPKAEKSAFQFLDYRVRGFEFDGANRKNVEGEFDLDIQFSTDVQSVREEEVGSSFEAQTSNFEAVEYNVVELSFSLEWTPSPGPFQLQCTIEGLFARSAQMTNSDFRDFSEILAPSLLFSHARPLVNMLMTEAKEHFRLPLLNISQAIQEQRAEAVGQE